MEVAPFSVKKHLIQNESGNLVVVIAIMGMIAGLIAYWSSLSGKVDKEVRSLGATQSTTFMRADFRNTIKKSLQGRNTACTTSAPGLATSFGTKFKDFQADSTTATLEKIYTSDFTASNAELKCFFNVSRYTGLQWDKIKISIHRSTEPNYMSLSNFISADVMAVFKVGGKPTVLKYQMKYRIDVLSLNHYGLIFTDSDAGALFDISTLSKVKINAPVLFDEADRTDSFPLSNIMVLPDTGRLIFALEAYTTAPGFTSNADVIDFLSNKIVFDVFKKGVEYNQLTKDPAFKAPYQVNPAEWNELLDFFDITTGGYPLPNQSPTAINFTNPGVRYTYAAGNHSNTANIYNHLYGADSEKKVIDSCQTATDISTGPYFLMIHNNLTQDFTIDFTKNIENGFPPVFCGLVAAKDLIIKLNGNSATDAFYQHHIIGKFILKGKVKVENAGSLTIHDMMEFSEDMIEYVGFPIDITNLRTQAYNQKYFSAQNFFLPFFLPGFPAGAPSTPATLMGTNNDKYYVPRSTKTFFNVPCHTGNSCRNPDILTPPSLEHLAQTHWQHLMFEVFDVE